MRTYVWILVILVGVVLSLMGRDGVLIGLQAIRGFVTGTVDQMTLEPQYVKHRNNQPLVGKNCFITGSSRGLGKAISAELVALGCNVYLGQRDKDIPTVSEVKSQAESLLGNDKGYKIGNAEIVYLDLSDLESIEAAVEWLESRKIEIDIFILNAVVVPSYTKLTKQGFEMAFGVNFLGHAHLLNLLISHGIVKANENSKVIFVISDAHKLALPIEKNDFGQVKQFTTSGAIDRYAHTKLCLTTYGVEFMRRNPNLNVLFYDPGPVNTDIIRDAPEWLLSVLKPLLALTFKSPSSAAMPVGYLSYSPIQSGTYLLFWSNSTLSEEALKQEKGKFVWENGQALIQNRAPIN